MLKYSKMILAFVASGLLGVAAAGGAQSQERIGGAEKENENENVVSIAAAGYQSGYSRYADEIREVLEGDAAGGLRILPILTRGGGQNALDVLNLRGVDMGFTTQDALIYLRRKEPAVYENVRRRVAYIAKIANSEFHVLVRADVKGYADLRRKKINCLSKLSSTHLMCRNIFETLRLEAEITNYPAEVALRKLKAGEIDASVQSAGAPLPVMAGVQSSDRLHLAPLDGQKFSAEDFGKLMALYAPAHLGHEQYPNLISKGERVLTLANSIILIVYDWPEESGQHHRLAQFVTKFFDNIDEFRKEAYHPKWREINLAAVAPGWKRFGPAQAWLDARRLGGRFRPEPLGEARRHEEFNAFLSNYEKAGGPKAEDDEQKAAMYKQFLNWLAEQRLNMEGRKGTRGE